MQHQTVGISSTFQFGRLSDRKFRLLYGKSLNQILTHNLKREIGKEYIKRASERARKRTIVRWSEEQKGEWPLCVHVSRSIAATEKPFLLAKKRAEETPKGYLFFVWQRHCVTLCYKQRPSLMAVHCGQHRRHTQAYSLAIRLPSLFASFCISKSFGNCSLAWAAATCERLLWATSSYFELHWITLLQSVRFSAALCSIRMYEFAAVRECLGMSFVKMKSSFGKVYNVNFTCGFQKLLF